MRSWRIRALAGGYDGWPITRLKLGLLTGILIACHAFSVEAAIREVGAGQTNSTIQACENAASSGDICNIHAGSYRETVIVTKGITFQNNAGESPVLTGTFSVGSTANVTITCNNGGGAMAITGYGSASFSAQGVFQDGGTGLTVTGCLIHNGYGPSLYSRNSTKLRISSNQFYNNLTGAAGSDGAGLIIISGHSTDGTYGNGVTIANNTVHDNNIDGLQFHGQYFTVSGNTIYNNIQTNWAEVHPDGMQLNAGSADGFTSVQHAKIFNNTVRNSTQLIFLEGSAGGASSDCEDIWLWNNILYMDSSTVNGVNLDALGVNQLVIKFSKSVHVYNNTLGRSGSNAIFVQSGFNGSIDIKNNIVANTLGTGIYVDTPANVPSGGLNYNQYATAREAIIWGTAFYATRNTFHAAMPAQETNGQDGNPLLNAYPTPTLQPGSPVITRAFDLSTICSVCATDKLGTIRPSGSAWDMGVYQFAGIVDLTPPSIPLNLTVK